MDGGKWADWRKKSQQYFLYDCIHFMCPIYHLRWLSPPAKRVGKLSSSQSTQLLPSIPSYVTVHHRRTTIVELSLKNLKPELLQETGKSATPHVKHPRIGFGVLVFGFDSSLWRFRAFTSLTHIAFTPTFLLRFLVFVFVAYSVRPSLRACLHVRNQQGLFFFFFFFFFFVCLIFTSQVLTLTFLLCCMV
jgi:hypothetical protein